MSLAKPVKGMKVIIPEYVQYNGRNYPVTAVETSESTVWAYDMILDKRRKDYGSFEKTGVKYRLTFQVFSACSQAASS